MPSQLLLQELGILFGKDEYEEGEVLLDLGEVGLLEELAILENITSCDKVHPTHHHIVYGVKCKLLVVNCLYPPPPPRCSLGFEQIGN
jgi:hypothetical protein